MTKTFQQYQPASPTEYFQSLGNIALQGQQTRTLQFEREKAIQEESRAAEKFQQEQQLIQDYIKSPNQQTLSQIAYSNPQAAESMIKVDEMYLKGQAKKVRSMHNTWQKVPSSQKAPLYDKWREQNQEDMAEYPLEYSEQTAPQIDFLFNQDNESAKSILEEKPVSTPGKLLQDVKKGFVPAGVAERKLQTAEPLLTPAQTATIPDLTDRADAIESLGEQNIERGNVKLGNQQLRKARTLRKEARENEKLIERDVQKLSKAFDKSGIVELVDSLETITSIINANPQDIPGTGQTAVIPGFALSREGQQLRQSIGTLRNSILKARSGGAVTPSEARRLLEELGTGIGKTDAQLRIGIQNVINTFQNKIRNIQGGFRPEAVNILADRSGSNLSEIISGLEIRDFTSEIAAAPISPEQARAELEKRRAK